MCSILRRNFVDVFAASRHARASSLTEREWITRRNTNRSTTPRYLRVTGEQLGAAGAPGSLQVSQYERDADRLPFRLDSRA